MKEKEVLPEALPEAEGTRSYPLECYDNRELSWLKFNARVLEEANDERNPLCERLSFLSIFQSNLDEFFMVRVGTLYDQRKTPIRDNKTRMTAKEQLGEVLAEVRSLLKSKDRSYKALMKQLKLMRIEVLRFEALSDKEKRAMERYFLSEVLPLLSPQIVAPKQPFPFLNNREIYAVASLKGKNGEKVLGIVPCSNPVLRRIVPVSPSSGRYILMEELIVHFCGRIFERYSLLSSSLIRIVRNADISIDDPSGDTEGRKKDYRKAMEKMIQTRKRLCPIKLEYAGLLDAEVIGQLCRYLKLPRKHAFYSASPLDLSFLYSVSDLLGENTALFYPRRRPQETPALTEERRVTDQLREKDVLLAFPYESIRPFLRLLNEAARDPEVISIKITLYRVAKNSQITDALIRAAENGKEVLVLMELRARFDEENNVEHSRDLENAGCRLIYGLDNIKVHSKLCLITYKRGDGVEYITQIGTGNYNEKTARLYTDYSLMTSGRSIGEEGAAVFQALSLGETVQEADTLLVAPNCLQNRICDKIDREIARAKAGEPAFLGFKLNSLTDKVLIDKLIEASQAGVKIRLLVRGICCLVSGIPGFTENIEVGSIVGRYLEHGRVYIFGAEGQEEVYISSADLMTRNTLHRVEIGVPLLDASIRTRMVQIFQTMWKDNVKLRRQQENGIYAYAEEGERTPFNVQEFFAEESYRACGLPLPEERGGAAAEGAQTDAPEPLPEAPAEPEEPESMEPLQPEPEQTQPEPEKTSFLRRLFHWLQK